MAKNKFIVENLVVITGYIYSGLISDRLTRTFTVREIIDNKHREKYYHAVISSIGDNSIIRDSNKDGVKFLTIADTMEWVYLYGKE